MHNCSDRALLATLAERGPIGMTSLANELEAHPLTVHERCYELQSDGHVRQVSGGVYTITGDGQTYLETLTD